MLVNNIFPKVKYPNDKKSIEHIIKEYDRKLDHKLGLSTSRKSEYILYLFGIINIIYMLMCSRVSLFIRLLYIVPLITCIIYNITLLKEVKKNNYSNKKLSYKLLNFDFIYVYTYIYSGIFMFQTVLFTEWTDKNYLIWFGILLFLLILFFIKSRIEAPKKFIKNYQYKESKLYTPSSIITVIVEILVSIAYFNKPYYFILIVSYIFLISICGLMTYVLFIYEQYDKIQELKKQINYIPKEK